MHWYIDENINVATEIDGEPWGLDDTLTLVARMPRKVRDEIEAELRQPPTTGEGDGNKRRSLFDELGVKPGEPVELTWDMIPLSDDDDDDSLALKAPWEMEDDKSHWLSEAQLATANRVVSEASEIYRRLVATLQRVVSEQEEALGPARDPWDDEDELIEEIYEPDYADAPLGNLFDDPVELDEEDYEEGWDPNDKPFEERFSIRSLAIPHDAPEKLVVSGHCDWDPEHGFELQL